MNLSGHPLHEHIVVDRVEELFKVHAHSPSVTFFDIGLYLFYRVMGRPVGSEPIAVIREPGVKDNRQYLGNGLLDHQIHHSWNTQGAQAARRLGYLNAFDRPRVVPSKRNCVCWQTTKTIVVKDKH